MELFFNAKSENSEANLGAELLVGSKTFTQIKFHIVGGAYRIARSPFEYLNEGAGKA